MGGITYNFDYGTDRKRYRKQHNQDVTYYIGPHEHRKPNTGSDEHRYTIYAYGRPVMLRREHTTTSTWYMHTDHLGSITAMTKNHDGSVIERYAYDAWGSRRSATDWLTPVTSVQWTNRGYTGHEHLDDISIIHMNGRIYAPQLGRMLSPDPVTQAPDDGQNYNRYSYAFNNPLKYTDPSGYQGMMAGFIAASIVKTLSGYFGGGSDCSRACQIFWMEAQAWCVSTSCLAPANPWLEGEDLEHNRQSRMNSLTTYQAYSVHLSQQTAAGDGGAEAIPEDIVGNEEMDAAAVEALEDLPYRRHEWGGTIDYVEGAYVVGKRVKGTADQTRIQPNEHTVAVYHAHPRFVRNTRQNRNNIPPGPGDHVAVEKHGYVNYYRDPFGNIRAIERINGAIRVRTVKGEDFKGQSDWEPTRK